MHPRAQRENAAKAKKQSFKELPEGWTREKEGAKYAAAPSKTLFLKSGEKNTPTSSSPGRRQTNGKILSKIQIQNKLEVV